MVQHQHIDAVGITMIGNRFELCQKNGLCFGSLLQTIPLRIEPLSELDGFICRFGSLNQAKGIARSDTHTVGTESEGTQDNLLGLRL